MKEIIFCQSEESAEFVYTVEDQTWNESRQVNNNNYNDHPPFKNNYDSDAEGHRQHDEDDEEKDVI